MSWVDEFEKSVEKECPSDYDLQVDCTLGCKNCWIKAITDVIDRLRD